MKKLLFGAVIFLSACNSKTADNNSGAAPAGKDNQNGELLFKMNCSQCHQPGKRFVGPDLTGVEQRWKNKALLYDFVRNSAEVIKRDDYAADLFAKWNQAPMLPFPQLSDEEIQSILDYSEAAALQQ